MADTRFGRVHFGTSKLFFRNFFICHGFDNIRSSNKHVRAVLYHEYKVSQRWRVYSSSCAWSHNQGDLWHNTWSINISLEDFRITSERLNTLLDSSTTRIVHTYHWCSCQDSLVHDLAYLFTHSLRKRSSKNSEILRVSKNSLSMNLSLSCYDSISVYLLFLHIKVTASVSHVFIILLEGSLIEE